MRRRRSGGISSVRVAVLLGVLAISACAGPEKTTSPMLGDTLFAQALESARDADVSSTQVAILERAAEKGEVELSDLREALAGTFGCLDSAGIAYREVLTEEPWGMTVLRYEMSVAPGTNVDESVALADECTRQFSEFVERLYVGQPSAVALLDDYRANVVRPEIEGCLEASSVPYDEEANFDDLWDTAFFAAMGDSGNRDLKDCLGNIEGSW